MRARRFRRRRAAHGFVGMMADAAVAATHEQHADRRDRCHFHGIVSGAAGQVQRRGFPGNARYRRCPLCLQVRGAGCAGSLSTRCTSARDIAPHGDML